ncbi:MAG: class II aldolase/adducin family protein [Chloroflexi bacterium]|nr:class II aldolase/adducin family protein [Chloroflexota bacterium]
METRWQKEREAVAEASREIARKGLVSGSAGNVSMRVGERLLAITPSRKRYDQLTAQQIQVIDFDGEPVIGDQVPSVESLMHVAAYQRRADVNAVVHTHSLYAGVLAVAHMELPPLLDEMVTSIGGEVKVTAYAFPSTEELAHNAAAALADRNAILLANHGAVGIGADLHEALSICELVERAAQIYVLAKLLGKVHLLPDEIVATEKELFKMMRSPKSPKP